MIVGAAPATTEGMPPTTNEIGASGRPAALVVGMKTDSKPTQGSNPARVMAVLDRRRSSAAGTHPGGVRGQRDRSGARRHAIAEASA